MNAATSEPAGFVRWLAPRYEAIRKRLAGERSAARDSFGKDVPHARTPAAVGDLWLGWEYYTTFAADVGAITATERDTLMVRVRAALVALTAAQTEHLRAADPVDQFLRLVPEVVVSGQAHLSGLTGGLPDHPGIFGWQEVLVGAGENAMPDWRARGNQVGWVDSQFVYLLPDAAFAEVQKVAVAQREPLTMAPRTLWSRLHERGLLAAVDERGGKVRHVVRLSVGGQRVSCLQFARPTLFPPTPAGDEGAGDAGKSGDILSATPADCAERAKDMPVGDAVRNEPEPADPAGVTEYF